MRELDTRSLELSMDFVQQKVRLLHSAQADLNIRVMNGNSYTPSTIRKAQNEVSFRGRILGGVLEELVDEAQKLLREIDPGQSAPVQRMARGD